ncbi:MAG: ribbon-helix-helix protein, CopG family [Clostridia bacterium]|nr:ribbon-helix-helix protein, CopG family [Clostridia bacterium]
MKGMMLIENKKPRTRIEVRLTEKQKEQIDRAAKRCGITTSEYLRQRALGGEPKAVLPDAFFVCCETLDRLTRAPYAKDVNDAALAVLIEMKNILTGGTALSTAIEDPAEKQEPESVRDTAAEEKSNTVEPKPKFKLFGRR